jgi:hypothetical protein
MATVSFFMEAYEDAAPYEMLDKLICQWRKSEERTREACGLDPILNTYPGCFRILFAVVVGLPTNVTDYTSGKHATTLGLSNSVN